MSQNARGQIAIEVNYSRLLFGDHYYPGDEAYIILFYEDDYDKVYVTLKHTHVRIKSVFAFQKRNMRPPSRYKVNVPAKKNLSAKKERAELQRLSKIDFCKNKPSIAQFERQRKLSNSFQSV